jgi:hypothetical protein
MMQGRVHHDLKGGNLVRFFGEQPSSLFTGFFYFSFLYVCCTNCLFFISSNELKVVLIPSKYADGSYRLVDLDNCRKAGVENHGLTTLEICPPEM